MADNVEDLGEFGLIRAVTARLPQTEAVLVGPGDDAAVMRVSGGIVVATTDLLVEGRHFRRDWSSFYDVGRKAAAANLADIEAMGARAIALLVGLATPPELPAADAFALTDGLRDEAYLVSASVVGGDVVRGDVVVVAVTALGVLAGTPPVTRSGAHPGDVVAVCGRLGWAGAGLALLLAGIAGPADVLAAHRRPAPPYGSGERAARLGARAMCDVSDGLLQDLGHLARASGVEITVEVDRVPVAPAVREAARLLDADPLDWVLTGGDDHALVACFPPGTRLGKDWLPVGSVAAGSGVRAGGYERLSGGWDHFR